MEKIKACRDKGNKDDAATCQICPWPRIIERRDHCVTGGTHYALLSAELIGLFQFASQPGLL
jgi:hypothetical protein